jgi:hypothetical protein
VEGVLSVRTTPFQFSPYSGDQFGKLDNFSYRRFVTHKPLVLYDKKGNLPGREIARFMPHV